jgi:hypothetical protein
MSNKYAVASGLWSATATWSDTDGGAGGAAVPADDDAVFISAAVLVTGDVDLSAYTGLRTVTIRGGATPGTLLFKNGTSGYPKIRTAYNLIGTTSTNKGRLLANSDGIWGNTGVLAFANKAVIDLQDTSQIDATNLDIALYCTQPSNLYARTYGSAHMGCTVSTSAETLGYTAHGLANGVIVYVTTSGTLPSPLAVDTPYFVVNTAADTFKLSLTQGGAAIDLTTQDGTSTTNVHSGMMKAWTVSTDDTLTYTNHGLANGTAVMLRSSNGVYPVPLAADTIYYVINTAANTINLALFSAGTAIDITSIAGIGTIDIYTGSIGPVPNLGGGTNPYTMPTMNVLDDVSSDSAWVTTSGHNRVVLVDADLVDYDQQRLTLTAIGAATITLSANVDSLQYPGARIYLTSRNVSIRSGGTTATQGIITASIGNVFGCEIINTAGSGTTFYGYGLYSSHSNTISGTISGCTFGLANSNSNTISGTISGCYSGLANNSNSNTISGTISGCYYGLNSSGNTISGTISGCTYGLASSSGNTISGTISGCYSGLANSSNSNTISGTISGCYYGLNSSHSNTISGTISGCYYGLYSSHSNTISGTISGCNFGLASSSGNTISGTISGCNFGLASSSGNTISGTISGCTYEGYFPFYGTNTLKNAATIALLSFYGRNTNYRPGRLCCENLARNDGIYKIFDAFGDITKTACDGTGDAPSVDPNGGHDYCIEVSNVQSNCGVVNNLLIFDKHRIWMTAAAHTVTYKVQTTYAGITAGNLKLFANYISTGGARAEVTNAPGIAVRANNADWTQTLAVTFTPSVAGWVDFKLDLMEYQSLKEVYVWPTPVIS